MSDHAARLRFQDLTSRRIDERGDAFRRQRDEPGRNRLDDVFIQRPESGEILPVRVELFRRLLQFLGDVGREQRRRVEAGKVRGDV